MTTGGITTYKPNYPKDLLDFYDKEERPSIKQFCKINNIPLSTFYLWLDNQPELLEAKKKAFELRRETFLDDLENLIVTNKDVRVNAFPLALVARRYGIKTKDDDTPPPPPVEPLTGDKAENFVEKFNEEF